MNYIAITLDVDWAPDFMIEKVANRLKECEVKATWFITHDSPAIQHLFDCPLFEVGIHPNFIPDTTQGDDYHQVMKYLMNIAPNAKTARTHGLFQFSVINKIMAVDFGIEIDSSIYLREVPNITPFETYYENHSLLRLPFFWTEDGEWNKPRPSFRLSDKNLETPGLKIFAFHPIHICLNSCDLKSYTLLKNECNVMECIEKQIERYVNTQSGANTLFEELIEQIIDTHGDSHTLCELADQWRNTCNVH